MKFETWFSLQHPEIPLASAQSVLQLVADGATVPFIARYRKEATGNLDEVKIQTAIDASEKWTAVIKRQQFILGEIEHQKKMTPDLKDKILTTFDSDLLEDLYLPYKQKRKTKATVAKEAGLEPLAEWIWDCGHGTQTPQPGQTLELWALTFKNEEKEIKDAATALSGAQDIIIERLSEMLTLRQYVRDRVFKEGCMKTGKGDKAKANSKFENYYSYHEKIENLLKPENTHRYLAIRRGWMEEELTLHVGGKPDDQGGDNGFEASLLKRFEGEAITVPNSPGAEILKKAARMALKAHVLPSIDAEVHKHLREVADEAAIKVFAENVRKLLLSSPFGPKAVLGVDPGIRTGCKIAVIDASGKFVGNTVIQLQDEVGKKNARVLLKEVLKNAEIKAIAVGNGTAGRETEIFLREAVKEAGHAHVPVAMVNESGASIYSASEVARDEFPDLDITVRGAISIARRLQDPLAELVKIDPKSIGVGQYQHDVSQPALKKSLSLVVDSCVNQVGVNLNTASQHLLAHVAGIGPGLAKSIVEFRGKTGLFKSRDQLLEVPRFTKKAFEQAAGFLRIPEGANPLDNTGVHPERYSVLEERAKKLGKQVQDLIGAGVAILKQDKEFRAQVGEFTYKDIISDLEKPGRDPRDAFVAFQYREDIHAVSDLQPGMMCPGIVTNVTNFGAFVDIGVHQDGLVHLSQLADHFVKDPREVVSPGDRVQVRVLEINLAKNQIALSLKSERKVGASAEQRTHSAPQARPQNRGSHPGGPIPKPKAPPQAFNNPFGGLAALKGQLKR